MIEVAVFDGSQPLRSPSTMVRAQISAAVRECRLFFMVALIVSTCRNDTWLHPFIFFPLEQQEEKLGREQRRKADDAIREAKGLREGFNRSKEVCTVSFFQFRLGDFLRAKPKTYCTAPNETFPVQHFVYFHS